MNPIKLNCKTCDQNGLIVSLTSQRGTDNYLSTIDTRNLARSSYEGRWRKDVRQATTLDLTCENCGTIEQLSIVKYANGELMLELGSALDLKQGIRGSWRYWGAQH